MQKLLQSSSTGASARVMKLDLELLENGQGRFHWGSLWGLTFSCCPHEAFQALAATSIQTALATATISPVPE